MKVKIDKNGIVSIGKRLAKLASPITREVAEELGEKVVREMLDQISKGISPIKGRGRFPRYKNTEKYPANVRGKYPNKTNSPVNLRLSGDFLDDLSFGVYKTKTGYGTAIFYISDESQSKEDGHREGAKGQPKRPTLPAKKLGETFSARIIRIIRDIYNDAISKK